MKKPLLFLAGSRAYKYIEKNGLAADDIAYVLAASGAAKWLGIQNLDLAVFRDFLSARTKPLNLFGTSIGAWKLAAAACRDIETAFNSLSDAYTYQFYEKPVRRADIDKEALRITKTFLNKELVEEILSHPVFRLHISTAYCNKILASENPLSIILSLAFAYLVNLKGRKAYLKLFERYCFHDPRESSFAEKAIKKKNKTPLTSANFSSALLASGSIPFLMSGVFNIEGAKPGVYRDGGLLDYHPLPLEAVKEGIVLYPHFYPEVTPGWFDKKKPKVRASAEELADVLILAPSPEYLASLPYGRIPDRRDFKYFEDDDAKRIDFWKKAVAESSRLGDDFLEVIERGDIAERLELLS